MSDKIILEKNAVIFIVSKQKSIKKFDAMQHNFYEKIANSNTKFLASLKVPTFNFYFS